MSESTPTFESLGLSSALLHAVKQNKFSRPYPIQQKTIPQAIAKKDILGLAQTGSGKTASYILPILQRIEEEKWTDSGRNIPALVLVPSRELAAQVLQVTDSLSKELPTRVKTMAVHGGVSINPQMKNMHGVQVLIATTGRLLDLIDSKALSLSELKILVLDEADKMLNPGFQEELDKLLSMMPVKRQNLLFSATLNEKIKDVERVLLHQPVLVKIESEKKDVDLIQQRAFRVQPERKGPFLRYLIRTLVLEQVLIFTSSIKSADKLTEKLSKNGIEASATHSKKSNSARQQALTKFKDGDLRVLVATDLIARGIDIDFLPVVINYELPRSPKDYIHRIGRTGRAENPGQAFSLICPEDQHHFKVIQKKMGKWITLEGTEEVDLHGC
jgi:ATP-dependent RNA helicase RhlE